MEETRARRAATYGGPEDERERGRRTRACEDGMESTATSRWLEYIDQRRFLFFFPPLLFSLILRWDLGLDMMRWDPNRCGLELNGHQGGWEGSD